MWAKEPTAHSPVTAGQQLKVETRHQNCLLCFCAFESHPALQYFTTLNNDNYCLDQDTEVCALHLKSVYDKLCILAIHRSPSGNFSTFYTNFDLILHKFFELKFNFITCGDININYPMENYKKNKLDNILHYFNPSSIFNVPTRIGPNSFSTIQNVFIDNAYLNKFGIIPLINRFSDHDAQLLTIEFAQKHNKD